MGEKQAEPLIDPDTSKILGVERVSNSVSALLYIIRRASEEENEIRTTALVVIDRRRMLEQEDAFDVPFQGRTTYHDTFCFVELCFGLWFDGCTC